MKYSEIIRVRKTAGFTLIELLVVIVMVGVLAAIAAPGWLTFLNRQRVTAVRSDLTQVLRNTQQDAIQKRQARQVRVVNDLARPVVEIGPIGVNGLVQILGGDSQNPGQVILGSYAVNPVSGEKNQSIESVAFDHQGIPVNRDNLPFVITISAAQSSVKQCVIVASLLGSIKTASGGECDNPAVAID